MAALLSPDQGKIRNIFIITQYLLIDVSILTQAGASPTRGAIGETKIGKETKAKDQEEAPKCNHLNHLCPSLIFEESQTVHSIKAMCCAVILQ